MQLTTIIVLVIILNILVKKRKKSLIKTNDPLKTKDPLQRIIVNHPINTTKTKI
jgi:hypothetical protein